MMRYLAILAAAAVLGGCGSDPEVDLRNASAEEVDEKVRAASGDETFVRPGLWASSVTIESIDMPGAPPQMAEQIKRALAEQHQQKFESCLTAEEAKRPKEDFFAGRNNQCRYDHFTMSDGKIDARMNCSQGSNSHVMEMSGTYSPDSYAMRVKMEGKPGDGPAMTIATRVDARRTGECPAGQS
jgi:hypothetical protein